MILQTKKSLHLHKLLPELHTVKEPDDQQKDVWRGLSVVCETKF